MFISAVLNIDGYFLVFSAMSKKARAFGCGFKVLSEQNMILFLFEF